jgi:hypothetical protein
MHNRLYGVYRFAKTNPDCLPLRNSRNVLLCSLVIGALRHQLFWLPHLPCDDILVRRGQMPLSLTCSHAPIMNSTSSVFPTTTGCLLLLNYLRIFFTNIRDSLRSASPHENPFSLAGEVDHVKALSAPIEEASNATI